MLQSSANFSGFATAGSRMSNAASTKGPHTNMITCIQVKEQDSTMCKVISTSGKHWLIG